MISVLTAVSFKIFGETLLAARMIGILCGLAAIYLMFQICKKMFKRDDIAIVAAALTAISPLFVFFSRNVQLVNPALLFMLLSWYFFLDWRESLALKKGILTALFLMLSLLTKYSFFLIAIPMLATIPKKVWKEVGGAAKKFNLKKLKPYLIYGALMLPVPAWYAYAKVLEAKSGMTTVSSSIFTADMAGILSSSWWTAVKGYVADNYTMIGFIIAIVGLLLVYFMKKDSFGNKFTLWYAAGSVPWILMMVGQLGGHSYHQYPIAPLIIILMSYALVAVVTNIAGMVGKGVTRDYAKYGLLLLAVILLLIPSVSAASRQFDVQFLGLDIAGEYIKDHSSPEDRIIFSRGQSFGVLWHADRKGYGIPLPEADQIMAGEAQGVKWILLYQWGLGTFQNPGSAGYLQENYAPVQMGFMSNGEQTQLVYILLKKGGSFTQESLQAFPNEHGVDTKIYEFSKGYIEFAYSSAD